MKSFLLALQFLTIIPVGAKLAFDKNRLSRATAWFPMVGIVLGLILVGANTFMTVVQLGQFPTNVILVMLLIILTGGLHMDGLADTSDAFFSQRHKSDMLRIMRDSRIGTMGVLSLISIVLLKISLLSSLYSGTKNSSLVLMCLLSRYAMAFAMFQFPYARKEGKAKLFIEGMDKKTIYPSAAITLAFAIIFFGLKGMAVFIMVMLFVKLLGKFITSKIGGLTGDTLGAINELVEGFVLLSIVILA